MVLVHFRKTAYQYKICGSDLPLIIPLLFIIYLLLIFFCYIVVVDVSVIIIFILFIFFVCVCVLGSDYGLCSFYMMVHLKFLKDNALFPSFHFIHC
jgi:hypothetical protein